MKGGISSRRNGKCKGPEAGPCLGFERMQECNSVLVSKRRAGEEAERESRATANSEFIPWGAKLQASLCLLNLKTQELFYPVVTMLPSSHKCKPGVSSSCGLEGQIIQGLRGS